MSHKVIPGLIFAITLVVFFIIELLFIRNQHSSKEIIKSIFFGIIASACAGLVIFWFTGIFGKWVTGGFDHTKFADHSRSLNLAAKESILFQSGANLSYGLEIASGTLYLTNERLIFNSHQLKNPDQKIIIYLSGIHNIDHLNSRGHAGNEFSIQTNQNLEFKFRVDEVEEWLLKLRKEKT